MSIHVAILRPQYLRLILDGTKTVESRVYRALMPPIGCAHVGERVYLKQSGGPYRAVAQIAAVKEYHDLTPGKVDELARRYNKHVCGDEDYWHSKRDARYASFIRLADVQPTDVGPAYPKSMRAWHVLEDKADVIWDVSVKAGNLKNNHLYIPADCGCALNRKRLRLVLPDGEVVDTDVTAHRYVRWRGWGRYYEAHHVRPGDRVRLTALGDDQYRVQFLPHA